MKINNVILSFMIIAVGGNASALSLNIVPTSGLKSGVIADGTLLARGEISNTSEHCGFKIWRDDASNSSRSDRYRLFSAGKALNIRLNAPKLIQDELNRVAVINSRNKRETFEILADGDQVVSAATWQVLLNGAVLPCDN